MAKQRIRELDTLRAIAFMAVVLQHAIGIYNQRGGLGLYTKWAMAFMFSLAKFAVPTFVFITGLVLFYNYYDSLDCRTFFAKRFREILVPYLIWSFLYTFRNLHSWPFTAEFLQAYAKNLLLGTASYHLWFIVLIVQFYILFPVWRLLFRGAARVLPSSAYRYAVLAAAFVSFLMLTEWASPGHFRTGSPLFMKLIKYRDRTFLLWFGYFLLGGLAGFNLDKFYTILKRIAVPGLIVYLGFTGYFTYYLSHRQETLNLTFVTSFKSSMVLTSLAAIASYYFLSVYISNNLTDRFPFFDILGRYSFGAYLGHALVLHYTTIFVTGLTPNAGVLFHLSLTFVLAIILSLALALLLGKIPVGSLVVGRVYKGQVKNQKNAGFW